MNEGPKWLKENLGKTTITVFWFQNHSLHEIKYSLEGLQVLSHITFYNLISSGIIGFKKFTSPVGLCHKLPNASEMT